MVIYRGFYSFIFLFSFTLFSISLSGQCPDDSLNMELLYKYVDLNQPAASGVNYNDVWGYVDTAGNEYGILGAADSILIFNVTNTDSIYKADSRPGDGVSIWRDMKTYDKYLYAGCDNCGEGIKVFDLGSLPDSFVQVNQFTTDFVNAHNIYIDTAAARLYAVGTDGASGIAEGFAIYDLAANPVSPPLLKKLRLDTLPGEVSSINYYIHDIFVRDNIAYCSHARTGYGIWNVANVDSIYKLSILALPDPDNRTYVHSSWNTDDNNFAYVASEVFGNEQIYVIDQSDPENTFLDTIWKEPLLACNGVTNNVPHNPYIIDNYAYISYYQDGVQILDVSNPAVPVRVGYYDTHPNNAAYNGTTGNWGVYPFLPSGTIIASETDSGFFALKFTPPVVPIELQSFEVSPGRVSNQALVSWKVASAVNVREFQLQRSSNGLDFEEIDRSMFDPNMDEYQYLDKNLGSGQYYYRLKSVDYDGSFKMSEIRSIKIEDELGLVIFPSASRDIINIEISKDDTWNYSIYNSAGYLVTQSSFEGKNLALSIDDYTSGIYFILLNNKQQKVSSRFQKIN